jgi:hypothetical protein
LSRKIALDASAPVFDTIDCPDGLARCKDGHLERSRFAQVSAHAPSGCPWEAAETCPHGCVEDVLIAAELAAQLCYADAGVFTEKNTSASPDECAHGSKWACAAAEVVDCPAKRAVAVCLHGCAISELDDDIGAMDAKTILCIH